MHSVDAIMADFLTGPLTLDEAVNRLVGIGYLREDAEDQVIEWLHDSKPVSNGERTHATR